MHLPKFVVFAALVFFVVGGGALAGVDDPVSEVAAVSGDPDKPRRHFRVRDPARLDPAAAAAIYRERADGLPDIYGLSGDETAKNYQKWQS